MPKVLSSTLLLTVLLAIGLFFFLRAASKDRTTVVDIFSPRPPIEVLDGITLWLEERGWMRDGGDLDKRLLSFRGSVSSSRALAVLLSFYATIGAACIGLVFVQLYPMMGWWPLLLACLGPIAGFFYQKKANRTEIVELRLVSPAESNKSALRVRAHRDELIAMELELAKSLDLASDGALLSSPV